MSGSGVEYTRLTDVKPEVGIHILECLTSSATEGPIRKLAIRRGHGMCTAPY